MKAARNIEMAAPSSESINLKGGTKSIFRKSNPTLPNKKQLFNQVENAFGVKL